MAADVETCVRYLVEAGADRTRHSGRVLLDHLRRTHKILRIAEAPEAVCAAGLFHSVYGTNSFKHVTIDHGRRADVAAMIGEEAESIVWLFSRLQRPKAIKAHLSGACVDLRDVSTLDAAVQRQHLDACALIEAANLAEQQQLWRYRWLHRFAREKGILDDEGTCCLRSAPEARRHVDQAVMLANYKAQVCAEIDAHINELLTPVAAPSATRALLRQAKLQEAQQIEAATSEQQRNDIFLANFKLVTNFAKVRGMSPVDAAAMILDKAEYAQQTLFISEMLRDRLHGRVERTMEVAELTQIRRSLQRLRLADLLDDSDEIQSSAPVG